MSASQQLFPRKRDDGSCSVAARFAVSSPELVEVVAQRTRARFVARPEMQDDLDKVEGLSFECFFDHVAGGPHPASRRRQQP